MFDTELIKLVIKSVRYVVVLAIGCSLALGIDWQWPDLLGHRTWRPILSLVAILAWTYIGVIAVIALVAHIRESRQKAALRKLAEDGRAGDARRQEAEREEKRNRTRANIRDLRDQASEVFMMLICRDQRTFHAPYHQPAIRELRDKGLVDYPHGDYDMDHHPFEVVAWVWEEFKSFREGWRERMPDWERRYKTLVDWTPDSYY